MDRVSGMGMFVIAAVSQGTDAGFIMGSHQGGRRVGEPKNCSKASYPKAESWGPSRK